MNTIDKRPLRAADLLKITPSILEGLYATGRTQLLDGDIASADQTASKYCMLDANAPRAWMLLAAVRQSMGRLAEAANLYLTALMIEPGDPAPAAFAIACFREAGLDGPADALQGCWGDSIEQRSDLRALVLGGGQ